MIIRLLSIIGLSMLMACNSQEGQSQDSKTESEQTEQVQQGSEPFVEVYDNGQPKIKGLLVDGERDGLWVSFYEDGTRWSEENYREGKRDGRTINFHPNGHLRYRGQYVDDEKTGLWQFYDEEGKLAKEMNF